MNKNRTLMLVIVMILASLTACASSNTDQTAIENNPIGVDANTQLIIGTLLLDGTEDEVTADEAAELLPLWKLYSTLSTSDTAAQEEINAVVTQIQNTMTDAQNTAIGKIDLVGQNAMRLMNESGLMEQLGFNPADNSASGGELQNGFEIPQGGDGGGFRPQAGDFPAGGPPGGGLGGGAGQDFTGMDPSFRATQRAESGITAPNGRSSQIFLQLLISYLEDKVTE
ncbi:MAG: hypothetical protein MUO40_04015 [Anaerolineaceae bacterium]|nr:hypothetical protein [Anaerolineaceae bacterium]